MGVGQGVGLLRFSSALPQSNALQNTENMQRKGYYSPPLKRETVSRMFHEAKSRGIPMTRLNDMIVEDGLNRLQRRIEDKSTR